MRIRSIRINVSTIAVLFIYFISGACGYLAEASAEIKIAAILSQTGIAIDHNKPAIEAARLAVDEINAKGGLLGHFLELILIDNQSTPIGSKLAAQKAVKLNVTAVIGAIWSSHSLAIAAVLQKAKIPMITPGSTKPEVTLTGEYIFRACFIDSFQGRVMAQFAYTDLGARTAVVLKNINEEYSLTLAKYFVKFFTESGGKVIYQGNYKGSAVDFTNILIEVKKLRPDVVFIPGYSRDSGLLVKQAEKSGIKTVFLGGDAWDGPIYEYGGSALEGSYYSAHWHPKVPFAKSRYLQKIYRKRYGEKDIIAPIPLTYDAVMLFADAVRRAGSVERSKIRDALAMTKNFKGATGTITFDSNGDPVNKEASIIKFENGSEVFVKSVRP